MKPGDIVKIYYDPLTEKELEGEAELLIKRESADPVFERWVVLFKNDQFRTDRLIRRR